MNPGFWRRFYAVLLPFAALLIVRDTLLDYHLLFRAESLQQAVLFNVTVWALWFLLAPAAAALASFVLRRTRRLRVPVFVALAFALSALQLYAHHLWIHSNMTFLRLAWGALTFGVLFALFSLRHLQEQSLSASLRAASAEKALKQAELLKLRSAMDPNFLFSEFHRASRMIEDDAEEADLELTKIADHLRGVLRQTTETAPSSAESVQPPAAAFTIDPRQWKRSLFGFCLATGAVMTIARILDNALVWCEPQPEWRSLLTTSLSWLGVALLIPFVLYMNRRYPITSLKHLPAHAAGCVLFYFAVAIPLMLWTNPPTEWIASLPLLMGNGLAWGFKADVYGGLLIAVVLLEYGRTAAEAEIRASQVQATLMRAQMEALRMQIHPHFLFNALNAVIELIHQDGGQARRMLQQLEEFLRITLLPDGEPLVSLQKEIHFLEQYLEMEKIRFHDRLSVEWCISPETLQDAVPPLLLQPIVENAVRHGIAPFPAGGKIHISSARKNGALLLTVRDTGPGLPQPETGEPATHKRAGIGLMNTRRRMDFHYGNNYRISMTSHTTDGLLMELEIPR